MKNIEPWERPHMRKWMRIFVVSGFAGLFVLVGVMWLFPDGEVEEWARVAIWTPFILSGAFLVPWSFHKGAELQRRRQAQQGGESPDDGEATDR